MKTSRKRIEKDFDVGSIRTVILDGKPVTMQVMYWIGLDTISFDITCGMSDSPIRVTLDFKYLEANYVCGSCDDLLSTENELRVSRVQESIRSLDLYQFERVEQYLKELGKLTT